MIDFDPRASGVRMVADSIVKGAMPTEALMIEIRRLNCAVAASLRNIVHPKKDA